jgi:2-polyprenyl-3-methyl-5-hydroxy-6-metoxy-1,4-benzoquinol methylase
MAKCTDKEFLDIELKMGVSLDNPQFMDLARNTVAQLNGYGASILDYGCGVGAYSKAAMEKGFQVYGFEKFKSHQEYLKTHLPDLLLFKKSFPKTDILMFIETAEHMTDDEINKLFEKINPIWILFSSTSQKTENDEMWGHINIKEQKEWDDMFFKLGYRVHKQVSLPTEWSKIYQLM